MHDIVETIVLPEEDCIHPASVYSHGRHLLQLPSECVEAIVRRVFDLPTLLSLLYVCKDLSAVAEKVIYEDPFQLTVGIGHRSLIHGRLLDQLLPLSPYQNEALDVMLNALKIVRQVPPTPAANGVPCTPVSVDDNSPAPSPSPTDTAAAAETSPLQPSATGPPARRSNVLSHLRAFDYDMDLYNTTYFHSAAYLITREIVDRYGLRWDAALRKVQSTIGWACYGHQLRQMRRLRIPIWDLECFVDNLDSLVNVRVLNFAATKVWSTPSQPQVAEELVVDQLRLVVSFIKAFQAAHGTERPQQCEIFNLDVVLGREEAKALEREFYQLLPPLPSPTQLTADNWHRMAARYEQVDLSQVTKIVYTDMRVEWPDRQHKVLERCQSLDFVNCVGLERDMFIFRKDLPAGWCSIRELQLQCNGFIMKDLVDTAMVALHGSLTRAVFTIRTASITLLDPEVSIGKQWPSFPALKTLHIQSKESIFLHPRALHDAPLLESLHLQDGTNMYNPYSLILYEPWQLPSLRVLYLQGMAAVAFHPQTFAGVPQLTNATIKGVKVDSKRYFMPRHPDNTPRGLPLAHLWTWDWLLPALVCLWMEGEPAYRFDFQWLEFCPRISELSLKVGGHRRPMLLSPALTARAKLAAKQKQQQQQQPLEQEQGQGGRITKDEDGQEKGTEEEGEEDDDDKQDRVLDWQALQAVEHQGHLSALMRQRRPKGDWSEDNMTTSPWIQSNLQHLELQGRWLLSDKALDQLLFRNLRRLKVLVLQGPKGYTCQGLLECTRRHWCLEKVDSMQMMTRADAKPLCLESPEERRWSRGAWRGGIQEWNLRPARDHNVGPPQPPGQEGSGEGINVVTEWDWETLNPEKGRRTRIPRWDQEEKEEEVDKGKNIQKNSTLKGKFKVPAPNPNRHDPTKNSRADAAETNAEDDGAPGPSSYLAGLLEDVEQRVPLASGQPQQDPQVQQTTETSASTNTMPEEAYEQGYIVYQFMSDYYRFQKTKKPIDIDYILD